MKAKFVLSKSKVLSQYDKVKAFGRISYSFKTNPEVALVLEQERDCDFSSHSLKPVEVIKDSSRVWFLPQGWSKDEIKYLLSKGVRKFVIDNLGDLKLLDQVVDVPITLLFRIKMKEHTIHTGKYFVYGFDTSEANELIKEYSEKSYVQSLGIHFHRKTENVSEWGILEELKESIKVWDKISIVNIGGGLPIEYVNVNDFSIDSIFAKIRELKDFLDSKSITLMLEPGRFIAGPAVKLVAEVTNVVGGTVFINCSVYNTFPDTMIMSLKLPVDGEVAEGVTYLIKGNTACSMDIFRYRVRLSHKLRSGDQIVFLNAGAYNFHTNFMWLDKLETEYED